MLNLIYNDLFCLNKEINGLLKQEFKRGHYYPPINIYEDKDEYVVIVQTPGMEKKDITITLEDNTLKISGQRKIAKNEQAAVHLKERFEGNFERSFDLNNKADQENIKAEMKNGLLTIKIPRAPELKPKKIEIN